MTRHLEAGRQSTWKVTKGAHAMNACPETHAGGHVLIGAGMIDPTRQVSNSIQNQSRIISD